MRLRTSFFALLLAVAPVALPFGNPHILIKGDPPDPIVIVDNNFGWAANEFGGGIFSFLNQTGNNWLELTVTAVLSNSTTAITCGPGPFATCTVSNRPVEGGFLYEIVFGPTSQGGGILNGELFSINMNDAGEDPNGIGSWAPGRQFEGLANDPSHIPEPSAALLMMSGLLLVAGWFRYRNRLWSRR